MPLLSITIPTKNRQKYCIEVIKHILSYKDKNFELIIQDNSDTKEISNFIDGVNDKRLKYHFTSAQLTSVENMSIAVEKAAGEYICMIGDDDTVLPAIFGYVSYMKKNSIDSLSTTFRPEYYWPDKNKNIKGYLKTVKFSNVDKIKSINIKDNLSALFSSSILDYQNSFLPRVYHGIVKKKHMDSIKAQTGSYFGGLSPDIYSTIALSAIVKKHISVNDFVTIAGACPQSTTSNSRFKDFSGELRDAPHFNNNINYKWDKLVPEFYCDQTIWAETAITAARDFNLNEEIRLYKKSKFFRGVLAKNKNISYIILKEYTKDQKHKRVMGIFLRMKSINYYFLDFLTRLYIKLFNKRTKVYQNIGNISGCVNKCI